MAQVNKIDSNSSGLRYTKEASIGVLPGGTPVWTQLEPNQYNDFGGQYKSVARNPINSGRQRKKGVTVDLDASGGFNTDLTQTNIQDLLQGFFFANLRPKIEFGNGSGVISGVTTTYNAASGLTFSVNDLIFASGFGLAANNGFKLVTSASGTAVGAAGLVAETPPAAAKLVRVGVRSASGDIDVDVSGTWPKITSTTLNFTTLGLIPGEWVFLGGDAGANQFTNAVNNGFKRIKSIAANAIEFDKSSTTMVAEANTTKLVDIYFGRVIKNEDGSDALHPIVRSSYQLERSLGAPDDASANLQYEYLPGSVANELTLNLQRADKINLDMAFVSTSHELVAAGSGPKTGTRPTVQDADAFNTSSDFTRSKMSIFAVGSSNPSALFAYLTEAKITIKNNVTPAKALGVLGAFDVTAGTFEVSGTLTAYFSNVAAINAVKNNSDVTLDFIIVKNNAGVAIDLPLIALGDGRAKVEQDQPILLPLNADAATAAKLDTATNHTLLMVFFDYLPSAADA